MSEADAERVWVQLERLIEAALRERAAHAVRLGLRPVDLDALRHVAVASGTTPTALGRMLQLSSGGTSAVVARLEAAGLVGRSEAARGRGRVALVPTRRCGVVLRGERESLVVDVDRLFAEHPCGGGAARQHLVALADAFVRRADLVALDAVRRRAPLCDVGPVVAWG